MRRDDGRERYKGKPTPKHLNTKHQNTKTTKQETRKKKKEEKRKKKEKRNKQGAQQKVRGNPKDWTARDWGGAPTRLRPTAQQSAEGQ